MEVKALLILLMLTCWLQQSGGTCTLQLTSQRGGEKIDLNLDCPSCQFSGTTLDVTDSCDAYSDLDLDSECTDANEECSKIYFLQNHSISSSNTKTDAADPDMIIEEIGQCSTVMTVMIAMGALVGILVMLLGVVTTGWVWTCWKLRRAKKTDSTQVSYRVNSYEDNSPTVELNNTLPNEEITPPPPVYAVPHKRSVLEPKYEKLSLSSSLPVLDLSGLGYDIPIKRQPKLKPPIRDDFVDESANKERDEYETLKYNTSK